MQTATNAAYSPGPAPTVDTTLGIGSQTTALEAAQIDAHIAARGNVNTERIMIELGYNDVYFGLPAEATWKTNYAYILDALHSRWPNAQVYCTKDWGAGYGTQFDTLAGWLDDVLVPRAAWAHLGPDKRVWVENGDGGTTYLVDGAHYSAAGCVEFVDQWKTIFGW